MSTPQATIAKDAARGVAAYRRIALRPSYRPFLDRAALSGSAAVSQMAEDFLLVSANAGSISRDDLEVLGWTPAQIERHGADARRYANRNAAG